jgi:peptidylprolyl isomerase
MDLAPDTKGKPRRVVIQLMPQPFSQGWIGNIRKLAAAHWWDGLSINRVQDNYVVQWGDGNAEDATKARALPAGLPQMSEQDYAIKLPQEFEARLISNTGRHQKTGALLSPPLTEELNFNMGTFQAGFPIVIGEGSNGTGISWPVHCYGMVGVGRDMPPNTGTGAELYVVIGHAPRHLDRNIGLVGRVVEGIEHLSSLPRGTGGLGFYETPEERTGIAAIRIGTEVADLPGYEYLSTESASFAIYADARANRRDAFFIRPAGGADICNIPVPVRRVKG